MSLILRLRPGWRKAKLSDLVFFQRGFDITKEEQRDGDIPVVSSSGVQSYHSKAKVDGPGVIIGRKGSLGTVHFVESAYWPHDTTLWSKDLKGNHPRFVYFFLHMMGFERYDVGNSNPTLNRNHIHNLDILIPEKDIQEKIANILSSYDDLIENNRRRIKLLEQAARLLYQEWFVRLRFPGHEHVKVNDGVPEGWERVSLFELADSVIYGYTASAHQEPIGPKFLRITDIVQDIIDWESVPFCEIDEKSLSKFSLQKGDIVVARTGATVGYAKRIGRLEQPTIFASYLVRFRFSDKIDDLIPGIFMESSEFRGFVLNNASGAAQPNANAKILSSALLLVPPKIIQEAFREVVEPIDQQKNLLQRENEKLSKARNLLLPRLMNGEIAL